MPRALQFSCAHGRNHTFQQENRCFFFRKNVGFCITLHLQTSQCTPWKLAAGTMFNVKAAKVEAITRRGGQSIKNGQATITVNTNTSHVGHVHSMRVCFLRTFVQPMII